MKKYKFNKMNYLSVAIVLKIINVVIILEVLEN